MESLPAHNQVEEVPHVLARRLKPGAELRAERARRDLSQTEVAEIIGVSRPVIVRAEKGESVQLDTALKLAVFYERPVEELFPVLDEAA